MNLRYKKLLAKEILIIVILVILCSLVYLGFKMYDKQIRQSNAEVHRKIEVVNSEIQVKTDSLSSFRSPLDLTEALRILNHWKKFDKNKKPKFIPNKPYEAYDENGIKKKVNPKSDSLQSVKLKNQIFQLEQNRKLFQSQLIENIDVDISVKKTILLLFIIAYPIRFLILGAIWSMKILKSKEN